MIKRIIFVVLVCLLVVVLTGSVSAVSTKADNPTVHYNYIDDFAQLLNKEELAALEKRLIEIKRFSDADVYVVTDTSYEYSARDYAENYLNEKQCENAVVFVYFSLEREAYIDSVGGCQYAITEDRREAIFDAITYDIRSKHYMSAFLRFADMSYNYITEYTVRNGELNSEPSFFDGFEWYHTVLLSLLIAVVIGSIVGFITVSVMKGKLKSVHYSYYAYDYILKDTLRVTKSREYFLYQTVVRTVRPKPNTNNRSGGFGRGFGSGGHSGSGRKF